MESEYLIKKWIVYTCVNCGLKYYFKYSNSELCATCRSDDILRIEANLQRANKANKDSIIAFNKSYIKSKKIDSCKVEIKVKETKNTYFNK